MRTSDKNLFLSRMTSSAWTFLRERRSGGGEGQKMLPWTNSSAIGLTVPLPKTTKNSVKIGEAALSQIQLAD